MPTNLYGPHDNYDLKSSHVMAALIRKTHEAKQTNSPSVEVWGTGTPKREFLHTDDLADACLFLLENVSQPGPINVGTGTDLTIRELAELIKEVIGYEGKLEFDPSKPDGTPRKLMDVDRLTSLGWQAKIQLRDGVEDAYQWFVENAAQVRGT